MKLDIGRRADEEMLSHCVLEAIDALSPYVRALRLVYNTNLYENTWTHEMQEHYVRCMRVLEDLRRWELCPHVLG